jgi:hypothetical protein
VAAKDPSEAWSQTRRLSLLKIPAKGKTSTLIAANQHYASSVCLLGF